MAKKIGAIVSLSIIGLLIIATIIMANVKVDFSIQTAEPKTIWIGVGSVGNGEIEANAEQKNKIVDYINNASKETSLTAMFNGNLNNKATVVTKKGTISTSSNVFYVRYHYDNAQDLKEGKKIFKDADGNSYKFDELVFAVKDVDGVAVVNVYVIPDDMAHNVYTHYYELEADFAELYSYLDENF